MVIDFFLFIYSFCSRAHFEPAKTPADEKPKKSGDVFGDLLGSQGYDFATKRDTGPKTINAMRKAEMARDMDPEKLKIHDWVCIKKMLYALYLWQVLPWVHRELF